MVDPRFFIARQEEELIDRPIQIRQTDPVSPVENQIWYNWYEQRLKIFKSGIITIIADAGAMGASEVPVSQILDFSNNMNFFKVLAPASPTSYNIAAVNNMPEGYEHSLHIINTGSANVTISLPVAVFVNAGDSLVVAPGFQSVVRFFKGDGNTFASVRTFLIA